MQVTTFDNKFGLKKYLRDVTLTELAERIRTAKAPTKEKLRLLKLGVFGEIKSDKGSFRTDENMLYVTGCEGDYDGGKVSFESIVAKLEAAKVKAIVETTASHTPSEPRARVLCPFSKNLAPADRKQHSEHLNEILGGILAPESDTLSQPYYYGRVEGNPSHHVCVVDGEFIDLIPHTVKEKPPVKVKTPKVEVDPHESINTLALQHLDKWVPRIWPTAIEYRGGYRVTSAMLGRDLTEDLGLMPDGIKDFGIADQPGEKREGKRTAVQIVMEHYKIEAPEAVEWLRECFGMQRRVAVKLEPSINRNLDMVEQALLIADAPIYQQGIRLVHIFRLGKDDAPEQPLRRKAGTLGVHEVGDLRIIQYFDEHIAFWKRNADGIWVQVDAASCGWIVAHIKDRPDKWRLRHLTGIIECPSIRSDGSLITAQGYDPATGQFLDSGDLIIPPIPEHPTRDDAIKAMAVVTDVFREFPFVPDDDANRDSLIPLGARGVKSASRSVAISGLLTGTSRHLMDRAPMHGASANSIATGKSTLNEAISVVLTGRPAPVMTLPPDEVEAQKAVISTLLTGTPVINIDNVDEGTPIGGGVLAKCITEATFSGRLLGVNKDATVSTAVLWLANGNGLTFKADMASRALRGELDAGIENPQSHKFTRDIGTYVKEHRAEIVAALLTILRAHALAGWPMPDNHTKTRFLAWDRIVRAAIMWCGEPDPALTMGSVDADDPVKNDTRTMLDALHGTFGPNKFTSADIIAEIGKNNVALRNVIRGDLDGRSVTAHLKRSDKVIVGKRRLRRQVNSAQVVEFHVEVLP